jgi:hypothetical protein
MPAKKRATRRGWVDPDDAPEWSQEQFDRAEVALGGRIVSPAQGTITRARPAEEGRCESSYSYPAVASCVGTFSGDRTRLADADRRGATQVG